MISLPTELVHTLELPHTLIQEIKESAQQYPIKIPPYYLSRIKTGNLADPLLKQVLPSPEELRAEPGYALDPLGEQTCLVERGMLQKYQGRLLIVLSANCAIHCRFCFRRHYPYHRQKADPSTKQKVTDYLRAHPDIDEVIFSGGDPLMLTTAELRKWVAAVEHSGSVKRLRVHSRVPVVAPERLNDAFVNWWNGLALQKIMVLHTNHPQELGRSVGQALQRLRHTTLLNQAVLLKDINDSAAVQARLSRACFADNILPYYLHLPDRVLGTAHFAVSENKGRQIIATLRSELPGYLVPRLVRDVQQGPNKDIRA